MLNYTADPSFIAWRTALYTLSKVPGVYAKLSGLLSEMSETMRAQTAEDIWAATHPWLSVVLAAFGPGRTMFGSDWPVCEAGGVGPEAWPKWAKIVRRTCYMASLDEEEQKRIWAGTAVEAYGLEWE